MLILKKNKIFFTKIKYKKINNSVPIFILIISFIIFINIKNKTFLKIINFNIKSTLDIKDYIEYNENKTFILIKGKEYIDKCFNQRDSFVEYKINVKPEISSIIPVFNSEKTIYNAICSIQQQNYSDLEIILVDDFSNDKSLQIIKNLKERDIRIKIIENKKNMGSLYSRSIGVIMSKGKYIFPLDNDDMFFSDDIFDFNIKFVKKYDYDIIGFRAIQINNYKDNIHKMHDLYNYQQYPKKIVVYQPKLSTWILNENTTFPTHDVTIWAKFIKSKIYKEATNKLGLKRYSYFVSWGEDTIVNFIIFNTAKSFIFIHKYGIIHLNRKSSASYSMPNNIKIFGIIFLIDIIYDFSKRIINKDYAIKGAYTTKNLLKAYLNINNTNYIYFKHILNKFINCKMFSLTKRNQIKKDFKEFFL